MHTTPVHQLMSCKTKICMSVRDKSIIKQFLFDDNILNSFQSGFRTGHTTITAATVVLN